MTIIGNAATELMAELRDKSEELSVDRKLSPVQLRAAENELLQSINVCIERTEGQLADPSSERLYMGAILKNKLYEDLETLKATRDELLELMNVEEPQSGLEG